MARNEISDDEVVYRRIPAGPPFVKPPDCMTTANFKLRPGEEGLSVDRASHVSIEEALQGHGALPDSRLVRAKVFDIRRLCNGEGSPLNLDVVADPTEDNPAHALIITSAGKRFSKAVSKALRDCFRWVEETA